MVEFQGKFDESVTRNINNRTFKKLWWFFAVFSVVLVCLGIAGIVFREDGEDLSYGIALITFGVLFTPLVFILTKVLQKNLDKSMSVMSSDTTQNFKFYPDKLVITMVKQRYGEEESEYEATTTARYTYLYKVEETRDTYFLRISKVQYHVINKADLKQGTIEELNSILASNLGARFKRAR